MQSLLFPDYDREYQHGAETYRECFGFELPPKGTELELKYMDGLGWYLLWKLCPDIENMVHTAKKQELIKLSTKKGWNIKL
jgi:hypothetical protein